MIELVSIICTLIIASATYGYIHYRYRLHCARVEDEIRASERAYQDLFDRAPDMMAVVDAQSLIVTQCNKAFARALDFSKEDVIGRSILERFAPSCAERAHAVFRALLRSGTLNGADLEMRTRTGLVLDVLLSASALRDDKGNITAARVTCHDISARKRAEDAVRASEARKSAILESALDCIITMDSEGRIVDFNPAAERAFGYSRANVVGKSVAETIIPERMRERHWRGLRRFLDTGKGPVIGQRFEIQALRSDGSEFPVEMSITSTTPPGGSPFFVAYLRDISDRRKAADASAFLAAIVESSQDAIVGADLAGIITSWNQAAERIYGYSTAEALGRPVLFLVPPALQQAQVDLFARVRSGEQIRQNHTLRLHKDGSTIEVALTLAPIRDASGKIVGISKIARPLHGPGKGDGESETQPAETGFQTPP